MQFNAFIFSRETRPRRDPITRVDFAIYSIYHFGIFPDIVSDPLISHPNLLSGSPVMAAEDGIYSATYSNVSLSTFS